MLLLLFKITSQPGSSFRCGFGCSFKVTLRMIIWMLDFRASKKKNIPKRTTYDEGSGGRER
ncbi:hypothetical protein AXF42_Ash020395 [Apostasia shenzhenica]|uniref:Uncharacterized protein n=1 Tax=Apostasia shenzhenica TaxID=1088818 RepID=A0A2I0AA66_9ASPA|nr:hypothetical protein AXF42_Ash020395 [Apostasia shenzhenica]